MAQKETINLLMIMHFLLELLINLKLDIVIGWWIHPSSSSQNGIRFVKIVLFKTTVLMLLYSIHGFSGKAILRHRFAAYR